MEQDSGFHSGTGILKNLSQRIGFENQNSIQVLTQNIADTLFKKPPEGAEKGSYPLTPPAFPSPTDANG